MQRRENARLMPPPREGMAWRVVAGQASRPEAAAPIAGHSGAGSKASRSTTQPSRSRMRVVAHPPAPAVQTPPLPSS